MPVKILLITPPFTQLNAPYPATPYLKGFLQSQGYEVLQVDLGIELINTIFSRQGFQELFESIKNIRKRISKNSRHIIKNKTNYMQTIDQVMSFLQSRDNTLAQLLCNETFLPRASRFDPIPDMQ